MNEREERVSAVIRAHKTGLFHLIEKAVNIAAAVAKTGEGDIVPFYKTQDDELFEWALGLYSAILDAIDEYEAKNIIKPEPKL